MRLKIFFIFTILLLMYSCGIKRFIPENETLYTGATFKMTSEEKIKEIKSVEEELQAVLSPQPNDSKLGLLARYKVEQGKPGFLYRFIDKKIGQAPVYQSSVDVSKTENLILNRLENLGFFYSTVSSEIKKGTKKSEVVYTVKLKEPFKMETFQLDSDTVAIYKEIEKTLNESVLKKGERLIWLSLK